MWDVIWRGFSINCFSGLSGPSIFLVLISWTLTQCIIYGVFSTNITKGKIPIYCTFLVQRWHIQTAELSFRPQFLPQREQSPYTNHKKVRIHVNCLIFVQFKPKSEYADTFSQISQIWQVTKIHFQVTLFNVDGQTDIMKLVVATHFAKVCRKVKIKPPQMGLWCITIRTKRIF